MPSLPALAPLAAIELTSPGVRALTFRSPVTFNVASLMNALMPPLTVFCAYDPAKPADFLSPRSVTEPEPARISVGRPSSTARILTLEESGMTSSFNTPPRKIRSSIPLRSVSVSKMSMILFPLTSGSTVSRIPSLSRSVSKASTIPSPSVSFAYLVLASASSLILSPSVSIPSLTPSPSTSTSAEFGIPSLSRSASAESMIPSPSPSGPRSGRPVTTASTASGIPSLSESKASVSASSVIPSPSASGPPTTATLAAAGMPVFALTPSKIVTTDRVIVEAVTALTLN